MDTLYLVLPLFIIFTISLFTIWILGSFFLKSPTTTGRYLAIDGLRGYLALCVFTHHSYIWYYYIKTGTWQTAPSLFYGHLGDIPVALFFIITSFLFTNKLLSSYEENIDWYKLYIGRIFRLTPLLMFVVLGMVLIILIKQKGVLYDSILGILVKIFKWQSFNLLGMPLINNFQETSIIVAVVTWTLRYEWFFYLFLPILQIILLRKISKLPLLVSLGWLALFVYYIKKDYVSLDSFSTFLGGIFAAIIIRNSKLVSLLSNKYLHTLAILSLLITFYFDNIYGNWIAISLLTFTFLTIVCGNSFFGLLYSKLSILLGEITYSIYLLHGMFLFTTFNFFINPTKIGSVKEYWSLIFIATPLLIFICACSYKYIELPGLNYAKRLKHILHKKEKIIHYQ